MDMAQQISHQKYSAAARDALTPPREAEEGFLSGNQRLVDVRLRHIRSLCGVYDLVALAFHGGGKLVLRPYWCASINVRAKCVPAIPPAQTGAGAVSRGLPEPCTTGFPKQGPIRLWPITNELHSRNVP